MQGIRRLNTGLLIPLDSLDLALFCGLSECLLFFVICFLIGHLTVLLCLALFFGLCSSPPLEVVSLFSLSLSLTFVLSMLVMWLYREGHLDHTCSFFRAAASNAFGLEVAVVLKLCAEDAIEDVLAFFDKVGCLGGTLGALGS